MPPSVSILVTVYNRAAFVGETVKSILQSSYQDFEVILVDDASSDDSWEVIQLLAEADTRISAHRNESNLGDYPNRGKAISLSKGEFIKFVDADDMIYPHGLEVMVRALEANQEAALALSHSAIEDDSPYPILLDPKEAYRKHFLGQGCLNCGPSGAIFRREAFNEIGGFRDWGVLNDSDLWLRFASQWPVVLLPPALVWWRRHDGQEFAKGWATGAYLEKGFELQIETLAAPDCPLSKEERRLAISRVQQHHARRLIALATKGRKPGAAIRLLRKSGLNVSEILRGFRPYDQG